MENSKFNIFLIISISIHLVVGLTLSFIDLNYFRQPSLKIVEVSLLSIPPSKNFLEIARNMMEKICEKTEGLKNKEKIKNSFSSNNFKVRKNIIEKEDIIEKDFLIQKELEDINLKTHLRKVFAPDQVVISKEIPKDKLEHSLNISRNAVKESPLVASTIEREAKLLVKENESLLNNLSWATKISGPISLRKILYQEDFKVPSWIEKKGLNLQGKFKFWVLANGYVDRVLVEESFGFRQIDSLASSAILRWKFSALSNYIGNKEEWGLVDMKILLR